MRAWPVIISVAVLAGCGSTGSSASHDGTGRATARVEKCVDRLVSRSAAGHGPAVRRYVRVTYCARFASHGWVYADGALSIAAQHWLENGMRCVRADEGEPQHTVSCQQENGDEIECALLHVTRKREVTAYVAALQRKRAIHCDDGTPLTDLGVP